MRRRGNASRVTSFRRSRVQPRGTNENLRASAGNRPRRAAGAQWAARPGRRQLEPSAWPCYVLERSYNKYRTGADIAETVLTPASVKSTANLFHKQFVMKVDGKIEGSPFCAFAVAMRPPTYLTILRALLRASNDVVSATGRNRANLPAANSSAPCKIAPRPQLGATLSRCASGQPACAAHRQRQQLPVIKQNSLLAAVDTLGQTDG